MKVDCMVQGVVQWVKLGQGDWVVVDEEEEGKEVVAKGLEGMVVVVKVVVETVVVGMAGVAKAEAAMEEVVTAAAVTEVAGMEEAAKGEGARAMQPLRRCGSLLCEEFD